MLKNDTKFQPQTERANFCSFPTENAYLENETTIQQPVHPQQQHEATSTTTRMKRPKAALQCCLPVDESQEVLTR